MVKPYAFTLLLLAGMCCPNAEAQKRSLKSRQLTGVPIFNGSSATGYLEPISGKQTRTNNQHAKQAPGPLGTKIGQTYYDLQTQGSSANRILSHPDGTVSAVWAEECNPNTGSNYPYRGAGYNYHNGVTWLHGQTVPGSGQFTGTCNEPNSSNGPHFGIASKSVGWPEIVSTPIYQELVIAPDQNGVNLTGRPAKGTGGMGSWGATTDLAFSQHVFATGNMGAWPRAVANGYKVHLLYALNKPAPGNNEPVINGVIQPVVYNRSADGGLTWDKQNTTLPGLTGIRNLPGGPVTNPEGFTRIGADDYAIAVNGNHVAIVAGSMGNPWTLWKSVDNGTTFTRRVISKITPADTFVINNLADTVAFVNDKAHEILIDNNGMVHVWAGELLTKVATHAGGSVFTMGNMLYPATGERLLYWNEGMATGSKPTGIAWVEDTRLPSDPLDFMATPLTGMPYYLFGLVSMPTAALALNNRIYVVYSGAVKGISNNGQLTGQPYRDLYLVSRNANTGIWSTPVNIPRSLQLYPGSPGTSSAENYEECVFPSVAPVVAADGFLHLLFQHDLEPGTALGPDQDPEAENNIMYYKYDLNLNTGLAENDQALHTLAAFPNPTTGAVNLTVTLKKPALVLQVVKNLLGQEVTAQAATTLKAGANQLSADLSNQPAGVYFVTVQVDGSSVTRKIIRH